MAPSSQSSEPPQFPGRFTDHQSSQQNLQISGFIAVGVLQTQDGLGSQRCASCRRIECDSCRSCGLGFLEMFRRMRKAGLPWNHKSVCRVYGDMRSNMKRRTKKTGHHTRESAAARVNAIEPSMGAELYARHAIR